MRFSRAGGCKRYDAMLHAALPESQVARERDMVAILQVAVPCLEQAAMMMSTWTAQPTASACQSMSAAREQCRFAHSSDQRKASLASR